MIKTLNIVSLLIVVAVCVYNILRSRKTIREFEGIKLRPEQERKSLRSEVVEIFINTALCAVITIVIIQLLAAQ